MKSTFKVFIILILMVPTYSYAQEDLINSIDIEGINLMSYPKLDISLTGGLGYRFEPVVSGSFSQQKDHLTSLKSALAYGASAYYFYREGVGIGLVYSRFAKTSGMDFGADDPLTKPTYIETEKLSTDYYGASFYFRQSNNSEQFYFGPVVGLGYLYYADKITGKDDDYEPLNTFGTESFSGGSVALQLGMKAQRRINANFAVGFRLDLLMGLAGTEGFWQLRKSNSVQTESLSRIEFGLSVHYLK